MMILNHVTALLVGTPCAGRWPERTRMTATKIPWTEYSWNPVRYLDGWMCTKVSPGCWNCYAEAMNLRFGNNYRYGDFSSKAEFRLDEKTLNQPFHWHKPRHVFVQSMGDLFHEKIPIDFLEKIFRIIEQCPEHIFQILTKRPQRISRTILPPNVWLGLSVETEKYLWRVNGLNEIPAAVKFVSLEPLLEEIHIEDYIKWIDRYEDNGLDVYGQLIDWVIVGPETGSGRRPCKVEWIESIVEQCNAAGVPVF